MTCNRAKWTVVIATAAVLMAGWGVSWACDKAADTASVKPAAEAKPCGAKPPAVAADSQATPAAPCAAKPAAVAAVAETAPCPMQAEMAAKVAAGEKAPCPGHAAGDKPCCDKPCPAKAAAVAQNAPAAEPSR